MHANKFNELVLASPRRVAMPIAVYPGLALTGATLQDIVTNPQAQLEAVAALHERYQTPVVIAAMDLSAEAEAFGCAVQMAANEIPSVLGRLVTTKAQADHLTIPQPGDKRTAVHLEAVRRLRKQLGAPLLLGSCIGPFSLAARIVGVSEAMELTLMEPELIHRVLEKTTAFLSAYGRTFRAAGASGVIMAEPAAGLLSPASMTEFSSRYVRQINDQIGGEFTVILHNCAAKRLHLPALLATGLNTFHVAAPMDIVSVLTEIPADVVLCGNLDPMTVFDQLKPAEIEQRVTDLLAVTRGTANFVASSGCDLPSTVALGNLDAFYRAVDADLPVAARAKKQAAFHKG